MFSCAGASRLDEAPTEPRVRDLRWLQVTPLAFGFGKIVYGWWVNSADCISSTDMSRTRSHVSTRRALKTNRRDREKYWGFPCAYAKLEVYLQRLDMLHEGGGITGVRASNSLILRLGSGRFFYSRVFNEIQVPDVPQLSIVIIAPQFCTI